MSKNSHVTVRIEESKVKALERLSEKTNRSVSYLICKAIDEFLRKEQKKK